jgi:hypothetical protein
MFGLSRRESVGGGLGAHGPLLTREKKRNRRRAHRLGIEALEARLVLSLDTWTGAGTDNLWMDGTNWSSGVAPVAGDALVFPSGAAQLTNVNNFAANTSFDFVDFSGSGYSVSGNAISLTAGIETTFASGSAVSSINTTFAGATDQTPAAFVQSGSSLDLTGTLTGTVGLNVQGGGTLDVTQTNSLTGTTTVSGSGTTLLVDGTIGPVSIQSGSTLGGTGTVGNVASTGGTISPGDLPTATAILHTGSLVLDSASTLSVQLNGTTAGTDYDQIDTSGPVTLGQATLKYSVGYSPQNGDALTIISNGSGSNVSPSFSNLAQGASLLGYPLTINYFGPPNTYNVVLNGLLTPTVNVSGASSTVYGTDSTFTAQVSGTDGTPTGTVAFYNGQPNGGGTELGSGSLNFLGVASFTTTSSLTVPNSPYSIYAVYLPNGTGPYGSTISTQPLTVNITPAVLTVTATPTTLVYGQALPTFALTYSGFVNGDGTGSLTTVPTATTTATATSPPGTYSITPSGGSDPNYTFNYVPGALVITQASSTTTLTLPGSAIFAGQGATLTAQVSAVSPSTGIPTGSVYFVIDGTAAFGPATVNPTTGIATLTLPGLAAGAYSAYAIYTGSADFASSSSATSTFLVSKAAPSASVFTVPILNARGRLVAVDIVADVTSDTGVVPTGSVKYFLGVRGYATAPLVNGVASLRFPAARVLRHFLYVRYEGDSNFQATLSLSEIVNNASFRGASNAPTTQAQAVKAIKRSAGTPFTRMGTIGDFSVTKKDKG